mmetsp:Transcript_18548/g.33502  ORF Transcript_18548/g.33502 Transcript_18548/m.33502 type:complete len:471 (+) Transcript_18548:1761-3173(+)|eukprot:CAMPEP_0204898942 /NCGR_PEP_ID=MMETSP1397-20131031/1565_1 /ASSEMBLY_ACC=CAM_ASM_000891 /TAXON_ID=49980 /ORGANISM="Climacostomum Climacostomum virens, Strain Stock W-24" /LENGTH=470 /DNA_ID=CAMNT_0052066837 /DNA_START=1724 /DNA_END=3136 /DNA_ORIENTATION=-
MDQAAKLQHQRRVEHYLQEHSVYNLFEYLLKELVLDQPDDVLTYLARKLEAPKRRRYLLLGAVGSRSRPVAKDLATRLGIEFVCLNDVLKAEVAKKSGLGQEIATAWKWGAEVNDEIVIEVLLPIIQALESAGKSYLLEGCPYTRVQGLALLRAGVVPNVLVILSHNATEFTSTYIDRYVLENSDGITAETRNELKTSDKTKQLAQDALLAYEHNLIGVKAVFPSQWREVDGSGTIDKIVLRTEPVLKAKAKCYAPRKPFGVIILGPPGSGRSTQSRRVAERYGLVQVSTLQLLKDQVTRQTEIGLKLASIMHQGHLVPDDVIVQVVSARLKQEDCMVNGWVLDGSPKTIEQALELKQLGIVPSNVFFLDAPDTLVYDRVSQRRLDPVTGKYYGGLVIPETPEIGERLVSLVEDTHDVVKNRLGIYKSNRARLHAEYEAVATDLRADYDSHLLAEIIGDVLENSVPQDII